MNKMTIRQKILNKTAEIESKIIEIRHQIHQNPELSFAETETAALAATEMRKLGFEVKENIFGTGVLATFKNSNQPDSKTLLIRADMDALPVQEKNDLLFSSQKDGVMHACGHDGHTAILIGTALVLKELAADFNGNIKFLFQPGEETSGGAEGMIKEGVLKNPEVDAALGLHLWGSTPEGVVEYKSGPFMASPDHFDLKIIGRGGHAARPHNTIDPIPIGAEIISALQKIISRRIDPSESAVISVCNFEAGSTHNVIPDSAILKGTVRSLKSKIREQLADNIETVIKNICNIYGAEYEFDYVFGYPPVINNSEMTELLAQAAAKILGEDKVREKEKPEMGGEDFSFFGKELPSVFYFLGIAPEGKIINHHQSDFKFNDSVLKDGVAVMVQTALDFFVKESI
ncbi:N-acetyl-L,L-diaminopimelate deacetylase [Halanaerobium saccharolyticum subsp. saccharolyticum DSM 6643]|uniref:N-acetyl-L,L-diaminopimelate deacetylase n=1 Tax=Halanaerobium saccharolyticum subsp. saccharolyticum DSM 6643 TaxID=1293054 RepID=M5E2G6_9FIRM|nr:amidohydrolase [Halanaerobium saccharolyticum]CCU80718.1 N-acetyl-L,L-diaminopimelate deacetylase [Halanaerobium saccharolyticum subsp. saccharolyticum DSM 6643]